MIATLPLVEEIKSYLPDNATDEQVQRFANQVEQLKKLQGFFAQYPEEELRFTDTLARANKALNYKQPYRIGVIGITGAGKSTLINALLGYDLVLMKPIGKAATGTVLDIFLDVSEEEKETAKVVYRDESNISSLIEEFIERYKVDKSKLNGNINDPDFSTAFENLEPTDKLRDQELPYFIELRKSLTDILRQYAKQKEKNLYLRTDFSLDDNRDIENLKELIDENSQTNSNPETRQIGLIKSVTYHIKSDRNQKKLPTLELRGNICLVDLPGLDGSPLHDIIISEGIKEAHAVIFLLRPPRILGRGDTELLNRVRKYISLEGSVQSGERIFLVLNAKDEITADPNSPKLANLPRDMAELMDLLVPGYATQFAKRGGKHPYFETSSLAAYFAQKAIKGEPIEEPKTYEAIKEKLDVKGKDDPEILEVSQIPKLVEELTNFARDRRIEGQIREGKLALDSIVKSLLSQYEGEIGPLKDKLKVHSAQQQKEKALNSQQIDLEDLVSDFRITLEKRFEDLRKQLQEQAKTICAETDKALEQKMPQLWKEAFNSRKDRLTGRQMVRPIFEFFLSELQIYLWSHLTTCIPRLAAHLVRAYTNSLVNDKIAQKVANGCYNHVTDAQVQSTIQEWLEIKMHHNMIEMGRSIALTQITDPAYGFTALTDDKKPQHKELFDRLDNIPLRKDLNADDFKTFIPEVRKQYESCVSEYSISGLLNLYRYEMIVMENYLLNFISNEFDQIRNDNDPVLKAKIIASISDPDWESLQLLETKLVALSSLKN
jgi:GTPase SAR1 family protein